MTEFKTKIVVEMDYYDIFGLSDVNADDCKAEVKWNFELEMREWGVKSVLVTVPEQIIEIEGEYYSDEDEEYCSFTKKVRLAEVEVNLSEVEWDKCLQPKWIEQYKGKWTMEF